MLMTKTHKRFPYPMPYGWFAVERLDELPDTPITSTRLFGQDVIVWNDGAEHHVMSAICPHMGANISVGGRVNDGCLVCPFHEWEFDASGVNTKIPYAQGINRKGRLHVFPTMKCNGLLLAWYHPQRVEPLFGIPDVITADYAECAKLDWTVQTAWQEIAENSVDMAHFKSVHGLTRISEIGELHIDGHYRRVTSTQLFNSARGTFEGQLQSNNHGPGVGITTFDLLGGRLTSIVSVSPIDDEHVRVRFTFFHNNEGAAPKIGPPFASEVKRQFEEDIPIWETKHFLDSPALAPSEKPVMEFRKWAKQFYVLD
jgi:nitrite reductase/ring-hydroxylating ferredoxin subunit